MEPLAELYTQAHTYHQATTYGEQIYLEKYNEMGTCNG